MKKSIAIILSVILGLSLILNIGFFILYSTYTFPIEKRDRIFYVQMNAFKPNHNDLVEYQYRFFNKDLSPTVLDKFDNTIAELDEIHNELIFMVGGINPTDGKPKNTAERFVNSYFYQENNLRPLASKYLRDVLKNYLNDVEDLGIESNLKNPISMFNKYIEEPIFYSLSVPEAIAIIDEIAGLIYLDRLSYISDNFDCK